jgi:hypothetical protein
VTGPACRRYFTIEREVEEIGLWQVVNDPGAWGAQRPRILVLGFSKGFTQANAYHTEPFEAVPFKGMRARLTDALRRIGLLGDNETVDSRFAATEREFGFGSLVRCSLSRLNVAKDKRECTGEVMPKAFIEPVRAVVRRCAQTYLANLPDTVRLVVMLGSSDSYINGCRNLIRSLYGAGFKDVNKVAYQTSGVLWVHVAHPSRGNGNFTRWMIGAPSDASGVKLRSALEAISRSGRFRRVEAWYKALDLNR